MRFNINLATEPYQDLQRFLLRWGLVMFAAAVLTAALIYSSLTAIYSWRQSGAEARAVNAKIADLDRERAKAEAVLNRPENRDTRERSRFLNSLIARKAFSWTEVFADLEQTVPPRLHVVAIRPEVNEQNQLELRLTVAGTSRESAILLVRHLEESPHFTHARVDNETIQTTVQPGVDPVRFDISAVYIPPFGPRRAVTKTSAPQPEEPKAKPGVSNTPRAQATQPQNEARNGRR